MGMFDSFYDEAGNEWQTKAYGCVLANYRIGDHLPHLNEGLADYQIEVRGSLGTTVATVIGNILRAVPSERDQALPLVSGYGGIEDPGSTQQPPPHEAETGRVTTEEMDAESAETIKGFSPADDLRDEELRILYDQLRHEFVKQGVRHERLRNAVGVILVGAGRADSHTMRVLSAAYANDTAKDEEEPA